MKKEKTRRALRTFFRWLGWVVVIQFILFNLSAALYAHKFTRLYRQEQKESELKTNETNLFSKTIRLFSGYRFYKSALLGEPMFSFTSIYLETKEKIPLEAWYGRPDSSKGTVILFHGLMGNKSFVLPQATEFVNRGYAVMLVDVRGHGNSGGQATTIGFREAEEVKLAYDYAISQGANQPVYLWGISMGAVEIIKSVADYGLKPAGIILEMPFGSLQSHIKARMRMMGFPEQPSAFFITFWIGVERGFNALGFKLDKYAVKINCPVLMQYGTRDQLVRPKEVDAIYNAIPFPNKKLAIYEDATHQSLLQYDPVSWKKEIDEFLENGK